MAEKPVEPSRRNWIEPVVAGTNRADHVVHGVVFVSIRCLDQAEHGGERPESIRHSIHQSPARAVHGQHDARGHIEGAREHTELGSIMAAEGGDCEEVRPSSPKRALTLTFSLLNSRSEGAKSFVKSWNELMSVIASKSDALKQVA